MAMTPPSLPELEAFRNEEFPPDQNTHVEMVLQQATDTLWLFTRYEEYPADPRMARILKYAILDLTLWMLTQYDHRDEINSPFSSERIGSYSYSKAQQAARGESSGIYWLDMFFRLLSDPEDPSGAGSSWVSSERVFNPEGRTYAQQELYEKIQVHDPSEPWGF